MQNSWDKNDTYYSDDKMQVPYQDGYTTAPTNTYSPPDAMSTAGRKSLGGAYSVDGSIGQLGYAPPSFSSQTILPDESTLPVKPNFPRLCIRIWQLIASAATFAFQAGAPAFAGKGFPFEPALLYFVFGVSSVSFMWSSFLIYVYLTRRYGKGGKVKRPVLCIGDTFITICLGVGVFFEISKYPCAPGTLDGMCDMFNTGIFFGVTLFTVSTVATLWDIFGSLESIRN
ncbi:hypothetical protein INT44_002433 [Umbelopsis vinacea]|uniref:MARVEL domain-containing protein n=1 Tax=Umbelopsis vinacea TaxID=44442 RepID=A0A8H7Q5F4_9FUNG|nr:hypothetical protein INT44_002433 [Umbelopsis vinacea]